MDLISSNVTWIKIQFVDIWLSRYWICYIKLFSHFLFFYCCWKKRESWEKISGVWRLLTLEVFMLYRGGRSIWSNKTTLAYTCTYTQNGIHIKTTLLKLYMWRVSPTYLSCLSKKKKFHYKWNVHLCIYDYSQLMVLSGSETKVIIQFRASKSAMTFKILVESFHIKCNILITLIF